MTTNREQYGKPNPINLEANKRFKQFRAEVFDGQKQMAEAITKHGIKMSQADISKIERGYTALSNELRALLVKDFGLNSNWYDTGLGDKQLDKKDRKKNLRTNIEDYLIAYDQVNNELASIKTNHKMMVKLIGDLKDEIQNLKKEIQELKENK